MGREIDVQILPKAGMVNVTVAGAAGGGSKDAVKYTPQDLTDEQKAQARENIGAVSMVDLNQRVQVVDVNDIVSLQDTNLILVMSEEDGKVAEILPSGQAEEYGWLYDWQEGWRVADIAGFTYFGRTWLDLLRYMEEHSTPLSIVSNGVVRHDIAQTLTQAQQIQARTNIDAASKAQVTRIALNVGFTDKIKDTATTLEDLSNKVSIINVIDGDRIAGCILPSSQTGQIGWLYEFEEGWMLTKDVSSYEVGEHTWEDLLWYLDANSGKIVNAIRLALITGDLSQLTTEDKSTLVAAINEVNADKASSAALTAEVTRATAAEGALSGEIGDLSSLQTTAKDNLVNAINEVAQGGGGGGSEWEFIKDIVITEPVHRVSDSLGGEYKELMITFEQAVLIVNASGAGVTDKFYVWADPSEAAYGKMLQTGSSAGANVRPAYIWMSQFGDLRIVSSSLNTIYVSPQALYTCCAINSGFVKTFSEIYLQTVTAANNINANTIHIYGKR